MHKSRRNLEGHLSTHRGMLFATHFTATSSTLSSSADNIYSLELNQVGQELEIDANPYH